MVYIEHYRFSLGAADEELATSGIEGNAARALAAVVEAPADSRLSILTCTGLPPQRCVNARACTTSITSDSGPPLTATTPACTILGGFSAPSVNTSICSLSGSVTQISRLLSTNHPERAHAG